MTTTMIHKVKEVVIGAKEKTYRPDGTFYFSQKITIVQDFKDTEEQNEIFIFFKE